MLCLEPGPTLAARCREKVRDCPKVQVEESTFEAWSRRLAAARYGDLFRTHSEHRLLGAERREPLVEAVEDAIRRPGGEIELRHEAFLYLARVPGE